MVYFVGCKISKLMIIIYESSIVIAYTFSIEFFLPKQYNFRVDAPESFA